MTTTSIKAWLEIVSLKPAGDILLIQTLRNAIMTASVLASAALIAQMAVLAAAKQISIMLSVSLACMLAICASLAIWGIVQFASCGFSLQHQSANNTDLAKKLAKALGLVKASASILILALCLSALSVLSLNP